MTAQGERKTIGSGRGPLITYYYDLYKQFVGILSYEVEGMTYAFGAFDSVCNHLPKDYFENQDPEAMTNSVPEPEPQWSPETTTVKAEPEGDLAVEEPGEMYHVESNTAPKDVVIISPPQETPSQEEFEQTTLLVTKLETRLA